MSGPLLGIGDNRFYRLFKSAHKIPNGDFIDQSQTLYVVLLLIHQYHMLCLLITHQ